MYNINTKIHHYIINRTNQTKERYEALTNCTDTLKLLPTDITIIEVMNATLNILPLTNDGASIEQKNTGSGTTAPILNFPSASSSEIFSDLLSDCLAAFAIDWLDVKRSPVTVLWPKIVTRLS